MAARRTTRREALRAAGAAALAAAALPAVARASPLDVGGPGLRPLEAAVDLTARGVILPGTPQDYRVARAQPWWPRLRGVVSRLRLFADWPTLQPDPARALGDPASPGHPALLALDDQIRWAAHDGLAVMLVPYRYPPWANGTARLVPGSTADLAHGVADRARPDTPASLKAREYGLPPDGHGPDSAWGRFVGALVERYVTRGEEYGRIGMLEVVNEPNLQLWPQRSPGPAAAPFESGGTELTVHRAVAEMMLTADGLAAAAGGLRLLGPSTADAETDYPRLVSGVDAGFVEALLDELDRRGFGGGCHWEWSYHNYRDVEEGGARVAELRTRLAGRWRGLQRDGGAAVAATEGGCRLAAVGDAVPLEQRLHEQAQRLARAVERHRDATDLGAGVTLLTHYSALADPGYDCGLREPDGAPRPAFGAWCDALA